MEHIPPEDKPLDDDICKFFLDYAEEFELFCEKRFKEIKNKKRKR